MSFEKLIADIQQKKFLPVYFLTGEEAYFIDAITDKIQNSVLDESEREFNQSILFGKDVDAGQILEYARRYPMMASYQVVIVKEAQNIRNIEELQSYIEKPLSTTILVVNYKNKSLDKRKSFGKVLGQKGFLFEFKTLYDNQVPEWANQYVKTKGFSIQPKASALLSEYLGNSLSKISNELDKLFIVLPKGTAINEEHIEKNIGISKEFNAFELNNALGAKDILKTNRIVNYFASNPKDNPLVVTISLLYGFFSKVLVLHFTKDKSKQNLASVLKVNPFFVKDYETAARNYNPKKTVDIISFLREYDLKSKGVNSANTDDGELLKELTYKILH